MEKDKLESRKRACGHCSTSCPFLQEDGLYSLYCNLYLTQVTRDDMGSIECCKECLNDVNVAGNQQILKKLHEIDRKLEHIENMVRKIR